MGMGQHLRRWITGIVAVPVLFAVIFYAPAPVFAAVIGLFALAGLHEFLAMTLPWATVRQRGTALAAGALILAAATVGDAALILGVITLSVICVFLLHLLTIRTEVFDLDPVYRIGFGLLYVPVLMAHFILLRQSPRGIAWIFFVIILAFAGDIAAYYVGRTWGRRKLQAVISPGKSEEGILGLVLGSIAGCLLYRVFFFPTLGWEHAAVIAAVGAVIGQLGDLCESTIKRASGVKDSGFLLPGHGGVLDRLDCLLFITPFVYYYQFFVLK